MVILFMNVYLDIFAASVFLRVEDSSRPDGSRLEDDARVIDSASNPGFLDRRNINVFRSLKNYTLNAMNNNLMLIRVFFLQLRGTVWRRSPAFWIDPRKIVLCYT